MDAATAISSFEHWLESNTLSCSAQLLWYKLLSIATETGNQRIEISNEALMKRVGVKDMKSFIRHRTELVSSGLVSYSTGRRGCSSVFELFGDSPSNNGYYVGFSHTNDCLSGDSPTNKPNSMGIPQPISQKQPDCMGIPQPIPIYRIDPKKEVFKKEEILTTIDSPMDIDSITPSSPLSDSNNIYIHSAREEPVVPEKPKRQRKPVTIPPNVEDVRAYCLERKNGIDADEFMAYYGARDWFMTPTLKMKDWKRAVIYWETRKRKNGGGRNPSGEDRFANIQRRYEEAIREEMGEK